MTQNDSSYILKTFTDTSKDLRSNLFGNVHIGHKVAHTVHAHIQHMATSMFHNSPLGGAWVRWLGYVRFST